MLIYWLYCIHVGFKKGGKPSKAFTFDGSGSSGGNMEVKNVCIWHGDMGHPLKNPDVVPVSDGHSPPVRTKLNTHFDGQTGQTPQEHDYEEEGGDFECLPRTTLSELWQTMQTLGVTNNIMQPDSESWMHSLVKEVLSGIGIKHFQHVDNFYDNNKSERCVSVISESSVIRQYMSTLFPDYEQSFNGMPIQVSIYIPAAKDTAVFSPTNEEYSSVRIGIALSSLPLLTSMRNAAKLATETSISNIPGFSPFTDSPNNHGNTWNINSAGSHNSGSFSPGSGVMRIEVPPCYCAAPNRPHEAVCDLLYSCASAGGSTAGTIRSPVTKFLGPCDFSLTHIIDALSTRLIVHILLLLLADK